MGNFRKLSTKNTTNLENSSNRYKRNVVIGTAQRKLLRFFEKFPKKQTLEFYRKKRLKNLNFSC